MLPYLVLRIALLAAVGGRFVLGILALPHAQPRSTSQYEENDKLGAVASESSVCSRIGVDLIKAGGSAADALVGTVFCVGVIGTMDHQACLQIRLIEAAGMYHSGIGGGGFMIGKAQVPSRSTFSSALSIDQCHHKCVAPMARMKRSMFAKPLLLLHLRTCIMKT